MGGSLLYGTVRYGWLSKLKLEGQDDGQSMQYKYNSVQYSTVEGNEDRTR